MLSAQELDTQTDRRAKMTEAIAVPTSEHVAQIVSAGSLLDEDSAIIKLKLIL